jgi:type IV pilus assembly protein PilO
MRVGLRELVFLIVLLVVPVASYLGVFKPRNEQIGIAQREVEEKRAKLAKLNEVAQTIDDLNAEIRKGREAVQLVEAKLPSERDVQTILDNVTKLAQKSHLEVKSFKSEKQVPAASYMEQPLSIIIEGQFDGFYHFLQDLEALPRITRIQDLKLKKAAGQKDREEVTAQIRAEFTLSIYFQPSGEGGHVG